MAKAPLMAILLIVLMFVWMGCSLPFVSNTLGSNMVLQRSPQRASIWGWLQSGDTSVTVSFNSKVYNAKVSENEWRVDLDPTPAGGPHTILITGSGGSKAVLENVLFGDVWMCSGQSNMQFSLKAAFNSSEEIADANNFPNIRLFTVGQGNNTSTEPLQNLKWVEEKWSVASSTSVGNGIWSYFSAVCWLYGKYLFEKDPSVPLGMVSSNWGGTPVKAWSSPEANAICGVKTTKRGLKGPFDPSVLWNAMIVPFLEMTIKGAIWYQGEADVHQPEYYACAFPEMIKDWRKKWKTDEPEFPFFFVQLAAYTQGNPPGDDLPRQRIAQTAALKLPKVGMAVAMDLGDLGSPEGNIHPRDKQDVGKRLCLASESIAYNKDVRYRGPVAIEASLMTQKSTFEVLVRFDAATVGSKLVYKQKTCPPSILKTNCTEFELNMDSVWKPASAKIGTQPNTVILTIENSGTPPKQVRYAWSNWPLATIYNDIDLPAPPFNLTIHP